MRVIVTTLMFTLLFVSCGVPQKKTLELEGRIAELERLLDSYEETRLNREERQARVEKQVISLVQGLSQEIPEKLPMKQLPTSDSPQVKHSELQTVASETVKKEKPVERLKIIQPKPTTAHKGFSKRLLTDGQRIIAKLESKSTPLPKKPSSPLLHKKLPQSRFIGPDGKVFDINDFKGKKNVLLVFMRGFAGQICIACSAQTAVLSRTNQQFIDKDTQIIVVFPGPPSSVPSFLKAIKDLESSFELPFPVLLDINLTAVKKYGIEGVLAKPTSLVIDREGIVQFAYTGKKYDDRPPVRILLEKVGQINRAEK